MTALIPASLLVPGLVALAGVVVALLLDAGAKPRAAVTMLAASLVGAGATGLLMQVQSEPTASPTFVTYGGYGTLGSVGYLFAACALIAGFHRFVAPASGVAMASLIALGAAFSAALIATADLTVLVVSLAGLGVVAYALVYGSGTRRAESAAVRYFVQGAVASGLTVYGIALLLASSEGSGSLLALTFPDASWLRAGTLATALLMAALAFKVGAFPFHSWVPDSYESAYPPVTAYLVSVPKIAGLVALVTVVRGALSAGIVPGSVSVPLQVLAAGSLVFGSVGMLRQRSVARMLGYSSIAQVGYALVALSTGDGGAGPVSIFAVTYAVAACAAFVGIEAIGHVIPGWDGDIRGLAGLSRRAPVHAACMVVVLLSLTGMPLLVGFWGKLAVFAAALNVGAVWLALLAGVATAVSFGGYGSVIRWMYFHAEEAEAVDGGDAVDGRTTLGVLLFLTMVIVLGGIVPLVYGLAPMYALFGL